jgi:hypothetical protein
MATAAALGTQSRSQGDFGEALIDAFAAAGGLNSYFPRKDVGFDRCVESAAGKAIRIQVKTHAGVLNEIDGDVRYPLDVEAYDTLRLTYTLKTFLVVIEVPHDQSDWVGVMPLEYAIRHRAHFVSLLGAPATANTETITVGLPLANRVTPSALVDLVEVYG